MLRPKLILLLTDVLHSYLSASLSASVSIFCISAILEVPYYEPLYNHNNVSKDIHANWVRGATWCGAKDNKLVIVSPILEYGQMDIDPGSSGKFRREKSPLLKSQILSSRIVESVAFSVGAWNLRLGQHVFRDEIYCLQSNFFSFSSALGHFRVILFHDWRILRYKWEELVTHRRKNRDWDNCLSGVFCYYYSFTT